LDLVFNLNFFSFSGPHPNHNPTHLRKHEALSPNHQFSERMLCVKYSSAHVYMIRFPDRDPTRFCNSEPDPGWTGFWKKLNRIRYGYPNCTDHCSKLLNQSFFGYKSDWIKYLDRSIGIGSDRIIQIKFLDWIRISKISDLFTNADTAWSQKFRLTPVSSEFFHFMVCAQAHPQSDISHINYAKKTDD